MDRRESLDQAAPLPGIPSDSHAGRREKAGAAADSGAANRLAGRLSASGGAATLTRQASSLGTSRVQIDRNVQKRHSGAPIRQISISKRLSMQLGLSHEDPQQLLSKLEHRSQVEQREREREARMTWIRMVGIFVLFPVILIVLFAIGFAIESAPSIREIRPVQATVSDFFYSLVAGDSEYSHFVLETVVVSIFTIIGVVFQITAVLLEYATSQCSSNVLEIVGGDIRFYAPVLIWLNTATYATALQFGIGPTFSGAGHMCVLLPLFIISVIMLPFYFVFLMHNLRPGRITNKLVSMAVDISTQPTSRWIRGSSRLSMQTDEANVYARQATLIRLLEALGSIGLKAIQRNDKHVAYHAVEALRIFTVVYGESKSKWQGYWWVFPDRESPDSFSLSDELVSSIEEDRVWVEWKVLRQLQPLFRFALVPMRDLCFVIAVNTRKIAEPAAERGDFSVVDKCIKFMNTYVRLLINARDAGTLFCILLQYRLLITNLITFHAAATNGTVTPDTHRVSEVGVSQFEARIVKATQFLLYYSDVCTSSGMAFLVQVIAQDMAEIVVAASRANFSSTMQLLDALLQCGTKDDMAVCAAQIRLACRLHSSPRSAALVQKITEFLTRHSTEALGKAIAKMQSVTDKDFWEINDRQENLEFMTLELKQLLPSIVQQIENAREQRRTD